MSKKEIIKHHQGSFGFVHRHHVASASNRRKSQILFVFRSMATDEVIVLVVPSLEGQLLVAQFIGEAGDLEYYRSYFD